MSEFFFSIKRRIYVVVMYLIMNCIYILIGGGFMYLIEHEEEVDHLKEMSEYVAVVGLDGNQSDRLEDLGICTFPNHLTPHWTVTGSTFYAFTVITTIGYGAFAPVTVMGRVFTCIYAVPGIGIVAVVLTSVAGLVVEIAQGIANRNHRSSHNEPLIPTFVTLAGTNAFITEEDFKYMIRCMIKEKPDKRLINYVLKSCADPRGRLDQERTMNAIGLWFQLSSVVPSQSRCSGKHLSLTTSATIIWMVIWGGIFAKVEGWFMTEGLWFSFVSLSTIGFGDFAPDTFIGRVLGFFFMAPGLGMMGAWFGVLADIFKRWQFWKFVTLYENGTVSHKMLEAQGFAAVPLLESDRQRQLEKYWEMQHKTLPPESDKFHAEITPEAAAKKHQCLHGHMLRRMQVGMEIGQSGSHVHTCNVCKTTDIQHDIHRCRECDFDVCESCCAPTASVSPTLYQPPADFPEPSDASKSPGIADLNLSLLSDVSRPRVVRHQRHRRQSVAKALTTRNVEESPELVLEMVDLANELRGDRPPLTSSNLQKARRGSTASVPPIAAPTGVVQQSRRASLTSVLSSSPVQPVPQQARRASISSSGFTQGVISC
eukprot:TRINITY_DN5710_c0_g1_i1.p1 TRINITY_DN5710_c0_g1~~TRINITY_DN5710_c0_g1_i1.p1  ORF type:complete len:608 (+),score=69.06 TRINITY_DN5710_c0_g1_i1:38-1825(+)